MSLQSYHKTFVSYSLHLRLAQRMFPLVANCLEVIHDCYSIHVSRLFFLILLKNKNSLLYLFTLCSFELLSGTNIDNNIFSMSYLLIRQRITQTASFEQISSFRTLSIYPTYIRLYLTSHQKITPKF